MEPPSKLVQQSSSLETGASLRGQAESRSVAARCRTKHRIAVAIRMLWCAMIVWSPEMLFAQTPTASPIPAPAAPAEPDGITSGGYQIHSSIELCYRSTQVAGSGDMYDTLGDLQTGPAILV